MEAGNSKFLRPKGDVLSPHLYVANCGPAVGMSLETISAAFGKFGRVKDVHLADESGTRLVVTFDDVTSAQSAKEAWDGLPCECLGGRVLRMQYSVAKRPSQIAKEVPVWTSTSEMAIPGLYLIPNFVSDHEECRLLTAIDGNPWKELLKRRVQHYGYEFIYKTRNVNTAQYLGPLPDCLLSVLERITSLPEIRRAKDSLPLDQLTVNEYPPGVGLSPHVDTHSAFTDCILSLSLSGSCIMEFRKYTNEPQENQSRVNELTYEEKDSTSSNFSTDSDTYASSKRLSYSDRKVLFLPARSLLIMSGEARYAWHHYIPHHKEDIVNGKRLRRSSRRVSLTFRKVRKGPCNCQYQQYCDSQL